MYNVILRRHALSLGAATTLLAGCGGSQTMSAVPQAHALVERPSSMASWMQPVSSSQDLLYVSVGSIGYGGPVEVYTYPDAKHVGRLKGTDSAQGLCTDKAGDVYITNFQEKNVTEYAHGGTSPIKTLSVGDYSPVGCAIDPTTGNLAVANYSTSSGSTHGHVYVFPRAKGTPKAYYNPYLFAYLNCAYDDKGNLFVDGQGPGGHVNLVELPRGSDKLYRFMVNHNFDLPSSIQWDGKYLAVGDARSSKNKIYRFAVSGQRGTAVGNTPISANGLEWMNQFLIDGTNVLTFTPRRRGFWGLGSWYYTVGGKPYAINGRWYVGYYGLAISHK